MVTSWVTAWLPARIKPEHRGGPQAPTGKSSRPRTRPPPTVTGHLEHARLKAQASPRPARPVAAARAHITTSWPTSRSERGARNQRSGAISDARALSPPLTFCDSPSRVSKQNASRVSECSSLVTVTNADSRPSVHAGEAVTCGYAWKCDRPLAPGGLEMRLRAP